MKNRLKNETSPYLLQHADNPVNWFPWCEEAFDRARKEDKPIFLSIGYSTCHWCHVMSHESFEDEKTAEILNRNFISIKVDREERPDIDSIYMAVCQAFTGSGGWPMSIFMSWDKKPFFAGTYFPPTPRYGMPSFSELLAEIANQWDSNRNDLLASSEKIISHLKNKKAPPADELNEDIVQEAVNIFAHSFDYTYGGFGSAPKFPSPHNLLFLAFYAMQNDNKEILNMAGKTLLQMRKGGIFDHIGYGFSRYSTDRYFLVPHFEKMLYDNALLIIAYSCLFSITKNSVYLDTAEKTARYVLREMTSPGGGFYSAQDADSEGVEGKYYTFALEEITKVLGSERALKFSEIFDITNAGNFEGVNIPNLLKSGNLEADLEDEIKKLYDYRKGRYRLHLDDKILLSWNSLMITALSILYRVSGEKAYLNSAQNALSFIEENMRDDLTLYTSFRDGKHSASAFLDDYAFFVAALIELYNSTLDKSYLKKADVFCEEAIRRFFDEKNDGFFLCNKENNEFFMNPKETYDGAVPSGNSVMTYNLVRLYQLDGKASFKELLERQIDYMSKEAQEYPAGNSMFLLALLMYENPIAHITVALRDSSNLAEITKKLPFMANVSAVTDNSKYPLLNGMTTFYVCKNSRCLPPTNNLS